MYSYKIKISCLAPRWRRHRLTNLVLFLFISILIFVENLCSNPADVKMFRSHTKSIELLVLYGHLSKVPTVGACCDKNRKCWWISAK